MSRFAPAAPSRSAGWLAAILVVIVLLAGGAGALVLLAPHHVAYLLTPTTLVIEAPLGPWDQGRRVDRDHLGAAQAVDLAGSGWRTAGTGLPDFCVGHWRYPDLGAVWQATTCQRQVVSIALLNGSPPLLLAPAERDAFLTAFSTGMDGPFAAAPSDAQTSTSAVAALAGLLTLVLGGVVVMMLLSPRYLRFSIDRQDLVVHSLWGTRRVDLRGATVRHDPSLRLWLRLFGMGMPGQQIGWYRARGQTVMAYLTRPANAVWVVPTQGRAIVLSPQDVAGFIGRAVVAGAVPAGDESHGGPLGTTLGSTLGSTLRG